MGLHCDRAHLVTETVGDQGPGSWERQVCILEELVWQEV